MSEPKFLCGMKTVEGRRMEVIFPFTMIQYSGFRPNHPDNGRKYPPCMVSGKQLGDAAHRLVVNSLQVRASDDNYRGQAHHLHPPSMPDQAGPPSGRHGHGHGYHPGRNVDTTTPTRPWTGEIRGSPLLQVMVRDKIGMTAHAGVKASFVR
ncbi:hypothetical protein MLD38_035006 [Melastoma candidum]|uniref:Uncharacterized protein n=1 Tax=Melastoma candidum TaxID=119954 RepID=A0ACB9MDM4_9MYRT|nr:hypothetical protein MLD38_035006 [Melastoma candidum]